MAPWRSEFRGSYWPGPGIRFERGYAQRLPYADGEFDRVLSSMMFHHLDVDAKPLPRQRFSVSCDPAAGCIWSTWAAT
ncbi:class I SAM-dependent methyltransferase [Mycobacterium sp.]|uniref:class I SAM-dependent methyltransferase n=1 Tax=Mycobacterium sp. TaxID=1785 RepID=UPI003F9DB1E9